MEEYEFIAKRRLALLSYNLDVITIFAEPFVKSTTVNANVTTTTQDSSEVERYKPGAPVRIVKRLNEGGVIGASLRNTKTILWKQRANGCW